MLRGKLVRKGRKYYLECLIPDRSQVSVGFGSPCIQNIVNIRSPPLLPIVTRVQVGLRKSDPIARLKKKVALREMCRSWPRVMHDPLLSTPCAMHDLGSSF